MDHYSWSSNQRMPSMNASNYSEPTSPTTDCYLPLGEIKDLFQNRYYKRCAVKCESVLQNDAPMSHPLIKSFLNFYAALSYDALARNMALSSQGRHDTLALAEKYYLAAESSLPSPIFLSNVTATQLGHALSPMSSQIPTNRNSLASDRYSFVPNRLSTMSSNALTAFAMGKENHPPIDEAEIYDSESFYSDSIGHPSPLKIFKSRPLSKHFANGISTRQSMAMSDMSRYSLSAANQPFAELLGPLAAALNQYAEVHPERMADYDPGLEHEGDVSSVDSDQDSEDNLDSPLTPTMANIADLYHHIHMYNDNLTNFRFLLHSHLSSIHRLQELPPKEDKLRISSLQVPPASASATSTRPTSSGSGADNRSSRTSHLSSRSSSLMGRTRDADRVSAEEKRQLRQERIKAWSEAKATRQKTFDPERYQNLCKAALAEL